MFSYSLYPYLNHEFSHSVRYLLFSFFTFLLHSFSHLYPPYIVFINPPPSYDFFLIMYNIYRDIQNNVAYFTRKSIIITIYQLKKILILYNIFYKNKFILIENLGHFMIKNK